MLTTYSNSIKLIVADAHPIFRQGLISTLDQQHGIQIIGQAANGPELVDMVGKLKPDVVLTDIQLPIMNGIEATAAITGRFFNTDVIALSMSNKDYWIREMLAAGAKGFLLKNVNGEEIVKAIKAVLRNETYFSESTVSSMVKSITRSYTNASPHRPNFTDKELIVIKLLCKEYSNKEIAAQLRTSIRSVESARERIQQKIGSKNMIGIVVYAIKNGIMVLNEN
jgi:DNA-binding NarL/FixJ family response regulator